MKTSLRSLRGQNRVIPKAHFAAPREMDKEDYVQCLELAQEAGFAGPHTLIYDGPGDDEWEGLALEREVVNPYLN